LAYHELQYDCKRYVQAHHEGTIMRKDEDSGILQAALLGYQQQLESVNAKIADLRRRLGGRTAPAAGMASTRSPQKKHRISPEGRARIAAAQRRRWAATKKAAG
jgi:hypothetical protein